MNNLIKFINDNNTFIMVVLTAIYVLTTVGLLLGTILSNKISKKNLLMVYRPWVFLDLLLDNKYIYLRVKNTGVSAAFNIKYEIDPKELSSLIEKVKFLGPGTELKFVLSQFSDSHVKGKIIYEDGYGNQYEQSFQEDCSIYDISKGLVKKN